MRQKCSWPMSNFRSLTEILSAGAKFRKSGKSDCPFCLQEALHKDESSGLGRLAGR